MSLASPVSHLESYRVLLLAAWRSARVHRVNLSLTLLGSAALQGTQLAFIGVLLGAFGALAGWAVEEVAFLYGMRLCAHGICTIFFGQHMYSSYAVRNGDWDRFLLRPVNPLMQLLTRFFNPGSLGDLTLGLAIVLVAASNLSVNWSITLVVFAICAVLGGGLVEAGLQIGVSGLDFIVGPTSRVKEFIDLVLTNFGGYPMSIFGAAGTWLLTVLIPLAFMAYLPVTVILGRTEDLLIPAAFALLAPLAGPIVLGLGYHVFQQLSFRYVSPGS